VEITTELLAIFSFVLNAILISFIIKQYKFLQKQYETVNRPWLVLEHGERIVDNVGLSLENIGNLPAEKITISCKPTFYHGVEKSVPSDSEKEIVSIGIIVPKQKYNFTFNFLAIDDIATCEEMNVAIFVKYYFSKKEKTSKFNYVINNSVELSQITCEEAT
jgi:hypothetical protein